MGPTNRDDSPGTGRNPDRYSRTEDVQAEETSHGRQRVGGGHPRRKESLQHTLVHRSRSRDAHRSRSRSLDRKRRRSYSRSRSRTPPARFRKAHSRSRSRSASPSPRRRRHNSHSPSRSRSRERHKRKSKKDRRKRSRSRSSSGSGSDYSGSDHRHTKKKHRPRGEKERRKKEKKEKKKKKHATGSSSTRWGKYGIISETDIYNKTQEFRTWLLEERKINPEALSKDQERKEFQVFVEDYNTATLPHEKYYHMEAYERRMSALRAGEFVPPADDAYDPTWDMKAHATRHKKASAEQESYLNREQLLELRKVQNERIEMGRMKRLGMDIKQNMGVRMDGSMFDG